MDVTVDRSAAADAATFDAIVAHELGHVLGIGAHSPLADDLMFGAPRRPDPSERDARTLRVLLRVAPEVAF
jgi:predicted Zn-dependent protease